MLCTAHSLKTHCYVFQIIEDGLVNNTKELNSQLTLTLLKHFLDIF